MSPRWLNNLFPWVLILCQLLVMRVFRAKRIIGTLTALMAGWLLTLILLGILTTYILPALEGLSIPAIMEALSC